MFDGDPNIFWQLDDYDGYYVNQLGQVWSTRKYKEGRLLNLSLNTCGYPHVSLSLGKGKKHQRTVHRLVATCFLYNPDFLPHINHKDGVKTNNHVDNLEWCSQSHNTKHAFSTGLMVPRQGVKHHKAILSEQDVIEIWELLKTGMPQVDIAKRYGVKRGTITEIKKGRQWQHITKNL